MTAQAPHVESFTPNEFALILENLKDHAIFMITGEGIISSWNKGSERVFGYTDSEAIGHPFSTIFTPEDIQAGIPAKELETARSEGKAEDERWHERKDKSRFWASGAVIPIVGETGESRFIKIVRDATDRKRAEDADRMESIGRLAGGVAHDYNNMLTSIIGYSELLEASTPEESPHQGWLAEIQASAQRAATVTRDLLAFSRKQMIAPEQMNLNEVLHSLQGRLRLTLGERVRLVVDKDPDLEPVLLDKTQIEQVLLNLALNAREAMPEGGCVTIRTRSAAAAAGAAVHANEAAAATAASAATALNAASIANLGEISHGPSGEKPESEDKPFIALIFKDDGKGMDAETAAHAFDPFFSTKPKSTGSVGLGLSTAYGIIQQSGGTISVASVPGSGTEFVIHLPVFTAEEQRRSQYADFPGKVPGVPVPAQGGFRKTILLVEDEIAVRKLASEVLRSRGFRVLEAAQGEAGLAIFNAQPQGIDAVVTDVVMPRMNGLDMAKAMLSRLPETPILFMSGYSDDPVSRLNMPHRKCDFLEKPFSVKDLLEKIDKVVESKELSA